MCVCVSEQWPFLVCACDDCDHVCVSVWYKRLVPTELLPLMGTDQIVWDL